MASEVFVSAMLLITAVVASAILIAAVFPVVWTMVSTFSSASHDTDTRMRTDFKIVTTFANSTIPLVRNGGWAKIWIKNIGTTRIGVDEIDKSDVIVGLVGNMNRATLTTDWEPNVDNTWNYQLIDNNLNGLWDTGETLEIVAAKTEFTDDGLPVYFQFVLPNGVYRSAEFTTS